MSRLILVPYAFQVIRLGIAQMLLVHYLNQHTHQFLAQTDGSWFSESVDSRTDSVLFVNEPFRQELRTGSNDSLKKDPTQANDSFTSRTSLLPQRNWQQLGRLCEQTRRTDTAENKTLPLQWAPPSPFPHRLSVHINKPTRTSALTPFPRSYSGAVRTFLPRELKRQ